MHIYFSMLTQCEGVGISLRLEVVSISCRKEQSCAFIELEQSYAWEPLFTHAGAVFRQMRILVCVQSFRSGFGDRITLECKLAGNTSSRYLDNAPGNPETQRNFQINYFPANSISWTRALIWALPGQNNYQKVFITVGTVIPPADITCRNCDFEAGVDSEC